MFSQYKYKFECKPGRLDICSHYIKINHELTQDKKEILDQLLSSFPSASNSHCWPKKFAH